MSTKIHCSSLVAAFIATALLTLSGGSTVFAQDETKLLDTENNKGEIIVFHGPDDLNFDPSTIIIAVDVYGDDDVEVNGVTFIADKTDDVTTGVAEANGVTVTTTASNQIDDWSATTTFEGADQDSADNLATVMESIRWEGAPNPVSIVIEGLTPGAPYQVQLLTNEGRGPTRYRVWDITVEDELVADNISSIGRLNEDEWDETNSAAYVAEFIAPADGILNIEMAQDLGGDPPGGVDNNPILNAIVVHSALKGEPALLIEEGVVGNQEFGGALGMDFVVNLPINVTQLGAFDSEGDELALPITVELWSRSDGGTPDDFADDTGGAILASLTLEGEEGLLEGGTRFLPLPEPVVLEPGAYTIVGWGYGAGEPNFNVGAGDAEAEGLTIAQTDFITFVGGSRFGDAGLNGEWPATPDGGPANRYGAGNFKFSTTGDSDGDGMPDAWEEANGLNPADPADAATDLDGDTVTNLNEFINRTDPNSDDTDKDGLKDNVETGTGTWVSAENTGTSPTDPDTDRDGLSDGVETNTGTFASNTDTGSDPNKQDSDGDGVKDGTEVAQGFDPTNPLSFPGCESPILNDGFIAEILGPDDLHLDPSTVLIAVDVYGDQIDEGRNVNGVTFFSDRCDDCADTEGLLEVDGVTYKAESTHFIDGWAAPPDFTGGDGDSAEELAGIMEDIRWSAAPSELTVDIEGLSPGAPVEVQMLFNEGADRNRRWDIAVEDELAVDDFTSEGCRGDSGGVWSPENSFVYTFNASPSADGILNIVLQQDIGGEPSPGGDNNPILQGVIVHRGGPGTLFQITGIARSAAEVTLTWASLPGREYSVEYNADLANEIWIELDDGVQSEGEATSFTDDDAARTALPTGWYRIRDNSG